MSKVKDKIDAFNNTIADNTAWTLLNTGSSNFDVQKLVCVNNYCLKYKTTWFIKAFCGAFFAVALANLAMFFYDETKQEVILPSLFFILCGYGPLYFMSPVFFDKKNNSFSKGRKSAIFMDYIEINLAEIYALQLIGGCLGGNEYGIYQINLINKGSKRINVTFYSSEIKAKQDAKILKDFLNIELWDIT